MLAAFWLGAWAKETHQLRARAAKKMSVEEQARKKQQDSLLNYSLDDARRAAKEEAKYN